MYQISKLEPSLVSLQPPTIEDEMGLVSAIVVLANKMVHLHCKI